MEATGQHDMHAANSGAHVPSRPTAARLEQVRDNTSGGITGPASSTSVNHLPALSRPSVQQPFSHSSRPPPPRRCGSGRRRQPFHLGEGRGGRHLPGRQGVEANRDLGRSLALCPSVEKANTDRRPESALFGRFAAQGFHGGPNGAVQIDGKQWRVAAGGGSAVPAGSAPPPPSLDAEVPPVPGASIRAISELEHRRMQ